MMAMSRSLLGRAMRRSSRPLLPSPGASPIPFAGRFLAGAAVEAPVPSPYPTSAATRSLLARSGLSPAMGVRSYRSSSGSGRQLSTKEDIKDKVTDDPKLVTLIKWFLRKIGHPSQFTPEELQEWGRNHKGWKYTNPFGVFFWMYTVALVEVMVFDNWKRIKESFNEFVDGLTGTSQDSNAQNKKD